MESLWYHAWKEAQESHVASWKGLYNLTVETLHGQEEPAMASKKPARTSLPMSDCSSHPDPDPEATFFFRREKLVCCGGNLANPTTCKISARSPNDEIWRQLHFSRPRGKVCRDYPSRPKLSSLQLRP